ncbi:MAG: proteobacterial dedicated sortase system response regulator [Gammaproteobacteria bacterium]|nr:proteobacterial dedicated sortase system response regulator [Gammaproteobacteria bacterium]NND60387.1 proteobacterial dedicated sortase system response regulator [Gammaproteobacteria bacterium]
MAKQIAIVEDEPAIRHNYEDAFRRHGYDVRSYENRPDAMSGLRQKLPDCVVIDINLGDEPEGGFELCRELRSLSPDLPIIFLTARDSELDAISGLRLGADDYLTKDISIPHLMARVAALFRRTEAMRRAATDDDVVRRGRLSIDTDRMIVTWDDQPVPLTVTEFWLTHALARYPGHVKSRQQLMDAANVVLDDNTITSHIKRLRRKFKALDDDFDVIETVYGMGYRWRGSET